MMSMNQITAPNLVLSSPGDLVNLINSVPINLVCFDLNYAGFICSQT